MNTIKHFFIQYRRSLREFHFYREVSRKPFFPALRFLYILSFLVLFIHSIVFAVTAAFILPQLPQHIENVQNRLRSAYPHDLVITISDGTISTNKQEPLYVSIPEIQDAVGYDHLVTIDTKATAADYVNSRSLILVIKDGVIYPDASENSASYHIESAQTFGDMVIDYAAYQEGLRSLNDVLEQVPSIAPWVLVASVLLIPLLGALFVTGWRLLVLLILTGILVPISSIFGNKFSYGQLYRMGMYGMTVPVTLILVLNVIGLFTPMVLASCFLLWMVIVLSKVDNV